MTIDLVVSIHAVIARVNEINALLTPPSAAPAHSPAAAPVAVGAASGQSDFASMLQGAIGSPAAARVMPLGPNAGAGERIVNLARAEIGVRESPPGSNNSPRIAEYRSATAGAPGPGPWCAYFTSWVARQAGVPVGPNGSGFGSVDALYSWAQQSGKALAPGQPPQPGDLIVWDEHIGVVESVAADGTVHTIEGNSSDQVIRRQHAGGSALGYVRLG